MKNKYKVGDNIIDVYNDVGKIIRVLKYTTYCLYEVKFEFHRNITIVSESKIRGKVLLL